MRTKLLKIVTLLVALAAGNSSFSSATGATTLPIPKARDAAHAMTLPVFKLDEVRLDQAVKQLLDAVRQHAPKQSGVNVGLIVLPDDKATAGIKVSVNLKNVSLAEAAEQICKQVEGYELRDYGSASGEVLCLMMLPKSLRLKDGK